MSAVQALIDSCLEAVVSVMKFLKGRQNSPLSGLSGKRRINSVIALTNDILMSPDALTKMIATQPETAQETVDRHAAADNPARRI